MKEMTKNDIIRLQLLLPVLLLMLASCRNGASHDVSEFSQPIYSTQYAEGFSIKSIKAESYSASDGSEKSTTDSDGHSYGQSDGKSVIITSRNPWQGASNEVRSLFIRRGDDGVPQGYTGQVLNGDARRIVCMSSTSVAMLEAIGAADRIVGVSGKDYISSPTIAKRSKEIGDVGYEGNINYELLVSLRPDLVMLYGVNGASQMEGKLKEYGIPFMYVGDYLEESPLGKAEWMVAVAETVGMREKAENLFSPIAARYVALQSKVAGAEARSEGDWRPKVMLNTPYGDSWYIPSSQNYMSQIIRDAGGQLFDIGQGNESVTIDMERAYHLASQADYWLNVGASYPTLQSLKTGLPKFAGVKVISNENVYDNTLRSTPAGGNDFYESGVVCPDVVLRDVIKIFHPEFVSTPFVYYKQLK